ncbi:acetoacetate decarboxylase [Jatrophihabitans sp. GAS493]|uniref:acetoacetate decarboxylase family protein n=1 Tax=Jatrophihabitans sp. GAS493 TaxID=1907575 RepID=UPI000BB8BDF3|nr:acetoacetate decarboxylase family protein [Jatrophihabitans sp. GAS493]SOD71719.1 acetoacetate decarboxylase [Jatrophihabitans sp. GAS493]
MTAEYPAEPWHLVGQLHASVFLVPLAEVQEALTDAPSRGLPPGVHLVRLGGRCVVATAWVDYQPGGVLHYRELMSTLLVRSRWRLLPTITHIWVDSEQSRDGGKALWGIPKQLADFDFSDDSAEPAPAPARGRDFTAADESGAIAAGTIRPRRRLPVRVPVRFRVVQRLHGRAKVTPVRSRAGLGVAAATFTANPAGPLAFLAGRRPILTLTMHDFDMSFGG